MLASLCCCDDVIFATLDEMNDEIIPTFSNLSHTSARVEPRRDMNCCWLLLLFLQMLQWRKAVWLNFEFRYLTFSDVFIYFFQNPTVNDDLVLKTMGISLNKSERWLLTDTVQMKNLAVFARRGLYSCWVYFLPDLQTRLSGEWNFLIGDFWCWMQWWLHSSAD